MSENQLHPSLEQPTFIFRDVLSLWLFKYFSLNAAGLSLLLCLCLFRSPSHLKGGGEIQQFSLVSWNIKHIDKPLSTGHGIYLN